MQWSRLKFDSCCGRGVREKFQPHHLWECEAKHRCAEISAWISLGEKKLLQVFLFNSEIIFSQIAFAVLLLLCAVLGLAKGQTFQSGNSDAGNFGYPEPTYGAPVLNYGAQEPSYDAPQPSYGSSQQPQYTSSGGYGRRKRSNAP